MGKRVIALTATFFAATLGFKSFSYENPISTLSVDSGYFQDSARAFWRFGQEVDGVVSTGFDYINSTFVGDYILTRLVLAGVSYWQWNRLEYGFFVANHELGHGARFYSIGGTPIYHWNDEPWLGNIFSFWAGGFTRFGSGAQATSSTALTSPHIPPHSTFIIAAAGMNNSAHYAEFIEDQITYGGGGHLLQLPGYFRAKRDAATYVEITDGGQSGDVANVIADYAARGYSISPNDLRTGTLVARWLSSTHWIFLVSAFKYAFKSDPMVNAFYLGNYRMPDFSHFITSRGVSYKIRSGYKAGTNYYPLSLEYVYKGSPTLEVNFGYRNGLNSQQNTLGYELSVNSVGGFGATVDTTLYQTPTLDFTMGTSLFTYKSLQGERLIGRYFGGGIAGYELWARLSYDY